MDLGFAGHELQKDAREPQCILGQIASALQYTHERGIVHRDLKPGNVLVKIEPGGRWRLLLADFGVARDMDTASQRTQISGTFAFMAPEQFSGEFSPASDQYALAVSWCQLRGGRLPRKTPTRSHCRRIRAVTWSSSPT